MPKPHALPLTAALVLSAAAARAEPTLELYIQGPDEVLQGDPESSSVDAQGRISMGPDLVDLAPGVDRPVVSLVAGASGVYAGTAGGGLLRLTAGRQAKVLVPFPGQVVSALAQDKGGLYAATSPDGDIVRVDGAGKTTPFFQPGTKYVWALLPEAGGLLVATGAPGRVLQVSPQGRSEVLFDPGETHIRTLIRHPKRGLVAGGGQKGIVYQVEGKSAFALYDSELEEVTAFAVDTASGDLYAAVVSASSKGALQPSTWIGPVKGDAPEDESSPIKSSEVVRIRANGHVERIWTSKREGAMALAFDAKARRLYVATGAGPKGRARIYAVDAGARDRVSLFARLAPPMATTLVPAPTAGAFLVGTAPEGQVVQVGPGLVGQSVYLSVEQDLERISDLGRLWFDADVPPGAKVALSLRTGNTKTPDDTWSAWTAPVTDGDGGAIQVRRGRYAQFKAELSAAPKGQAPVLKSMHASVQRMNVPPEVKEVYLLRRGVYMAALPDEGEKERTVSLSTSLLKELRRPIVADADRTRVRQGEEPGMMTVAWSAEDANRDALLFRVELQALDGPGAQDGFRVVGDDLEHPFHSFDSRALPDGRYQFRVTASDRPSNPPDQALTDAYPSEPFTVDNAPPVIRAVTAEPVAGGVRVTAQAKDAVSPLAAAEVSLDGGPWLMLPAQDGLTDAPEETFTVVLGTLAGPGSAKLDPGPHTVRVRVTDVPGNQSAASGRFVAR
jgi:hypothetical protein